MLRVGVRGRHRAGRGEEDEALPLGHAADARRPGRERPRRGTGPAAPCRPGRARCSSGPSSSRWCRCCGRSRRAGRRCARPRPGRHLRQVAAVVLDAIGGQALGQLRDRLDGQQLVVGQGVPDAEGRAAEGLVEGLGSMLRMLLMTSSDLSVGSCARAQSRAARRSFACPGGRDGAGEPPAVGPQAVDHVVVGVGAGVLPAARGAARGTRARSRARAGRRARSRASCSSWAILKQKAPPPAIRLHFIATVRSSTESASS